MSGIAGIYKSGGRKLLGTMLSKIEHRGLSGRAMFFYGDSCSLGFAIHPDSSFFRDRRGCILVDGEVYGRNAGKISSEDLLSLFRERKNDFVKCINGEYAIAVYDAGSLMLVRDRLGVKPLYYSRCGDKIYFASEIKSLQAAAKEISSLPPGHFIGSECGLHRHWTAHYAAPLLSEPEKIMPLLRENLEKAVRKRLEGKSRVGIFLSGGIDSSIIAYLVKKNFGNVIFLSAGTRGSPDLKFSSMLAEYLKTPHFTIVYGRKDMEEILPGVIYSLESFDALLVRSSIPNFLVARLAKEKGIDTVFIGEGGDELFAGYDFLKNLKGRELQIKMTNLLLALYNTGFQRCDRIPSACGIEAKIPFFDTDFVRFALRISPALKTAANLQEKWILRKSFEGILPKEIVWRKKQKFSQGSGSYEMMEKAANTQISDKEFEKERIIDNSLTLRNKEELLYYRIFKKFFPSDSALRVIGRSIW
ncbi:asparagine synthetase B [Candidatus Desantisbacteria bacterium CG_4_10_14_0_8_um_filter_48_22]|uniref:Asparagine synthetase B n=1 Tax=Candidatus Desantisbacteria bacterium CG_4_10_14_0_8_um_filter_48_22 TaxID=1974543 RepID=A0A2M7SB74_9BACT|nr:MAG: hypothetical protein AUJ67_00380 [Candidatus Desantisbacteria bacterium CG1_02_49_89]PIV55451.1 MAG: asparagine synthetase B [Candidatus Desantisbacteria bacterium CG02_land_8_20_14_3_00_49_13]PIZ16796.1 MAG: asparagine synthetase B [Candidatus Desantisbacteria bacterium CG_4_10_14_0_8_um_filter_48_22]